MPTTIRSVSLFLDRPKEIYTEGDVISGRVVLGLYSETNISRVVVALRCREYPRAQSARDIGEAKPQVQGEDQPQFDVYDHLHHSITVFPLDQDLQVGSILFSAGDHSFTFALQIPDKTDAFETFYCKALSYIKWGIRAEVRCEPSESDATLDDVASDFGSLEHRIQQQLYLKAYPEIGAGSLRSWDKDNDLESYNDSEHTQFDEDSQHLFKSGSANIHFIPKRTIPLSALPSASVAASRQVYEQTITLVSPSEVTNVRGLFARKINTDPKLSCSVRLPKTGLAQAPLNPGLAILLSCDRDSAVAIKGVSATLRITNEITIKLDGYRGPYHEAVDVLRLDKINVMVGTAPIDLIRILQDSGARLPQLGGALVGTFESKYISRTASLQVVIHAHVRERGSYVKMHDFEIPVDLAPVEVNAMRQERDNARRGALSGQRPEQKSPSGASSGVKARRPSGSIRAIAGMFKSPTSKQIAQSS